MKSHDLQNDPVTPSLNLVNQYESTHLTLLSLKFLKPTLTIR